MTDSCADSPASVRGILEPFSQGDELRPTGRAFGVPTGGALGAAFPLGAGLGEALNTVGGGGMWGAGVGSLPKTDTGVDVLAASVASAPTKADAALLCSTSASRFVPAT